MSTSSIGETQCSLPDSVRARRRLPRRATLDGFVSELSAAQSRGVRLASLTPRTRLTVTTQNSTYRIVVREGATVLVQGGKFFPRLTGARLAGSGFGGSMLKLDWIGLGLRMELWSAGRPIITSPVRLIAIDHSPRC